MLLENHTLNLMSGTANTKAFGQNDLSNKVLYYGLVIYQLYVHCGLQPVIFVTMP